MPKLAGSPVFSSSKREEAGGIEHDAHHARPDARIAFRRQDRERGSVGADGGSVF